MNFTPRDLLDIFLVTLVLYYSYRLLRQSRALPILGGVVLFLALSIFSHRAQLEALGWLFDVISPYFVIGILVILQPELRRLFYHIGQARWYRTFIPVQQVPVDEITQACRQLSETKTGALIAIANKVGLRQYAESGVPVSGRISRELLLAIFYGKNPLHDGAVIIEGQNILAAACYLPLSTSSTIKRSHGARHRAGVGLSEDSDALVIIVSETSGKIALAFLGELRENVDPARLRKVLVAFNQNRLAEEFKTL
ncbi:MAG: diadenylate cyclase CdaA [Leptospiraceae bacterium]|nr:diadenylate cyclase CdaA [Leptospiraceae bacterium]